MADVVVADGAMLASAISFGLETAITGGNLTAAIASAAADVGSSAFAAARVMGYSVATQAPTSAPTSSGDDGAVAVGTLARAGSGISMHGWTILAILVVFLCAATAVVMTVRINRSSKPAAVPDWNNNKSKKLASSAKRPTMERRPAHREQQELESGDEGDDGEKEKDGEAASADSGARGGSTNIVVLDENEIPIIPIMSSRTVARGRHLSTRTRARMTPRDDTAQLHYQSTMKAAAVKVVAVDDVVRFELEIRNDNDDDAANDDAGDNDDADGNSALSAPEAEETPSFFLVASSARGGADHHAVEIRIDDDDADNADINAGGNDSLSDDADDDADEGNGVLSAAEKEDTLICATDISVAV